jgi:hypothetical protein
MDPITIIALVGKGLVIADALISAGQSAAPAITSLISLVSGTKAGTITQADLDKSEALLDSLVADFNLDLPPAQPGDPDYIKPVV